MKNIINSKKLKVIIMLVIISLSVFCLCSVASADYATDALDNYFSKQFKICRINYKSSENAQGQNESKAGYAVELPDNENKKVFASRNTNKLMIYGLQELKYKVRVYATQYYRGGTRTSWKGPIIELDTPVLAMNDENKARIVLTGFSVKDGKVYYDNDEVLDGTKYIEERLKFEFEVYEPIQKTYVVWYDNGTLRWGSEINQKGTFFLFAILEWIKDQIISILTGIFCDLLISIGDAIRSLIETIVGVGNVSLGKIIYNKIDKLNVNFWTAPSTTLTGQTVSIGQALKPLVSFWYGKFQGIVLIVYVMLLLYAGIRILITSTAGAWEKAKELFASWFLGLLMLITFPTFMKYTVEINESLVQSVEKGSQEIINLNSDDADAIEKIKEFANEYDNIPLCIVYIIMLGQVVVLLVVYYKRAFTLTYLIVIFPIVQCFYIYERISKGKGARAISTWIKEYVVTVFIQLVHAVVYAVLIEGMLSTLIDDDGNLSGNVVLYIFCVMFLFRAEAIAKQIFDVKSPGKAIGDAITTAATFGAVTKQVSKMVKSGSPKGTDAEDKEDANKHEKNVSQMQSNAGQNNKKAAQSDNTSENNSSGGSSTGISGVSGEGALPASSSSNTDSTEPAPQISTIQSNVTQDRLAEAEKAREVLAHIASRKKTRGVAGKVVRGTIKAATTATGGAIGLAVGLATGDVQKAVSNMAIGGTIGNKIGKGAGKIASYGVNRFSGAVMRAKVQNGGYRKQLKKAGVDVEKVYGKQKDDVIRKALAQTASAQVRGGDANANLKWAKAVDTKLKINETSNTNTTRRNDENNG